MRIKIGIDILEKKRFLESYKKGGSNFFEKIFSPYELRENSHDQLASLFCLKEAVAKALELPIPFWLAINAVRQDNGKVNIWFGDEKVAKSIISLDTSISHEQTLIVAVAVVILINN